MMKPKRMLLILCAITILLGAPDALAADSPAGRTGPAAYSNPAADNLRDPAADDAAESPLPSPLIGDEPTDSGGAFISTGAVIAVILAILLIVTLVVIRLWKRRPPGNSGQDIP